ncbi:hypothetical protein G3M48_005136 [Beauveria asiatica]|uniref:Uncharacterized protein n=1 Tax=Beauveria asiatica TaxID=1069075 RepID=A0AAW0RS64_9HYPO
MRPSIDAGRVSGADSVAIPRQSTARRLGSTKIYGDYDSSMIIHVLNYTQLWPFLTGDLMAAAAISNLDREIFHGPSGRYTDHTSWSPSSPPPVDKRGPTITSLYVRACDDRDGVGIKHNRTWDDIQGSDTGGSPTQLDPSPVKSVTRVRVQ